MVGPSSSTAALKLPCAPPEFLLAARAVRRPVDGSALEQALARTQDWDNFLAVVDKHRVAGLVFQGLAEYASWLPPVVLGGLRERARVISLRAVATAREASVLTKALEREGIPAAVLKGPALSTLAYGDVKLRHCRDVDLLVPRDDLVHAHAVLSQQGYRLYEGDRPTPEQLLAYLDLHKHLAYVHGRSEMQVELHGRLHDSPSFSNPTCSPDTWQTVSVGFGIQMRTLPAQDLLLYLFLHGAGHGWFRLKWLADVAAILHRHPEETEPLVRRAEEVGARRAVVQGLTLSAHLFGTILPAACVPDWAERRLIRIGWDALIRRKASTELYNERFASTRIRLSQLLLVLRPDHFISQLNFDLTVDQNGPSRVSPFLRRTAWQTAAAWLTQKSGIR